ncbi:MAG: hypothetical protein N3B12_05675 [Armatimonadetes bacterium]|nr:hypothetical protein [Armatimonadota bacterium]
MSGSSRRNLLAVVKRALRQPFSVGVLVLGAIFSIGYFSLIPVVGGVLIAAAYTIWKLQDAEFIRAAIREAGEREREAELMSRTFRIEELDVDSRVRMKAIVRLQNEIAEDVANSPVDEVAVGLADTVEQTEQVLERALAMAQKRRDLQRYLNRTDPEAIRSRIRSLEAELESETDPYRRSEIESSLAAKRQELEDYLAIEKASRRVLEQLDSIQYAFEGLRARLVRIKSTDVAEWTAANEELKIELGGLSTAVDTVERSIEEALTTR